MSYTWQRCNVGHQRLRRHSRAPPASPTRSAPRRREADPLRRVDLQARLRRVQQRHGQQECHDVTKNGASALTARGRAEADRRPRRLLRRRPCRASPMEDEVLRATGGDVDRAGHDHEGVLLAALQHRRRGLRHDPRRDRRRRTASPSADVGTRIRVVETASNEGGTSQAVSAVTAVVDELMPTASRPTIAGVQGRRCRTASARTGRREADGRQRSRSGSRSPTTAASGSTGVQVRATPTGLLAGSAAARGRADSNGWATFTFRATGTGHDLRVRRGPPEGREAQSRRLDREPVQGPRPLGPLGVGGFLPKHVCRTCEMRAFLLSAGRRGTHRKGATFVPVRTLAPSLIVARRSP